MTDFNTIDFVNDELVLINQTQLPLNEVYIKTDSYERIAESIEKLEVRGAPAIGVAAAYAVALAFKNHSPDDDSYFELVYNRLYNTRPTAVNLFWALAKMREVYESLSPVENPYSILLETARSIHKDDIIKCDSIANNALPIFSKEKMNVLTHCNAGQLATGGGGTALYVIRKGFEAGKVKYVYADETRPLLQGSRLTAFELEKAGIPFSINTDSTAGMLINQGMVDLVITGADRIASNGDTANKIGTLTLAVLCNYHKIPFYIAAPTSTIDTDISTGREIKIEERNKSEISFVHGIQITKEEYNVYSPAFDVTPNNLINGIITEEKLHLPPYNFNA